MNPVYLVDGCRSPIGRGHPDKGMYKDIRADELTVQIVRALLDRVGIDPSKIDDFYLGCVGQHLEQGKNLARLVILLADLPQTIPGVTINRLCASSMTALQMAADSIRAGSNHLMLVGGVEHMGHVPMTAALDYHTQLFEGSEFRWTNMGLTAEKLSAELEISREDQDVYALESNLRHLEARDAKFFEREIIPIRLPTGLEVTTDEEPRKSTPLDLAKLKPVFKEQGTVTAANSSGISDGAAAALVCDHASLNYLGNAPLARIVATANVGLDPSVMGLGPIGAINKLLSRMSLTVDDIDLFEINEAFAVQLIACRRELGIAHDRLNVHGGAVSLGHPLGMSGLRLAVTLAHSMVERNARRGIASLCVGHGQGVAMLLERD